MKWSIHLPVVLAAAVLTGCTSFTPLQTSWFTDEYGNLITVDYGRDVKPHESTFVAPNGRTMTMKSHHKVRVLLGDGTKFIGWECMNPLRTGTMYRSNDEKWMYHANGISCRVFQKTVNDKGEKDYLAVFEGVICEGPGRMDR
ncbi:MAG: hypothetical protein IJ829_05480 [Kiritimatiellae bacterium]|nr:hypothetical protein [Kiritimatiellia bacterium]